MRMHACSDVSAHLDKKHPRRTEAEPGWPPLLQLGTCPLWFPCCGSEAHHSKYTPPNHFGEGSGLWSQKVQDAAISVQFGLPLPT